MKSSNPLVTVLMTVYNGEKFLSQAIDSILRQTYSEFELLIIDDCSNDNSVNIIKSYNDKRIELVINENNLGQSITLNIGIKLAKGKYIARLDQDDVCFPNRLKHQIKYMESNHCTILGTWAERINENSTVTGYIQHPTNNEIIINAMAINCPLSHSSIIMNKKDIISIGMYSDHFLIAMDWELWIRAAKNNFKFNNIPEYLVKIRFHEQQTSKNNDALYYETLKLMADARRKISTIKKYEKYSLAWELYFLIKTSNYYPSWNKIRSDLYSFYLLIKLTIFYKLIKKPTFLYEPPSSKYFT